MVKILIWALGQIGTGTTEARKRKNLGTIGALRKLGLKIFVQIGTSTTEALGRRALGAYLGLWREWSKIKLKQNP